MEGESWRQKARRLQGDVFALALALRDPRVPWYAKALAACVVGYAASPIDLIPDFIPVLGYLDDLVLLPLGVMAVRRLVPESVFEECREKALRPGARPGGWIAAAVIGAIWLSLALGAGYGLLRWAWK